MPCGRPSTPTDSVAGSYILFGTLGGFRTSRDGLAQAKLALSHAIFGPLGGFRPPRDGLAQAKLALSHAMHGDSSYSRISRMTRRRVFADAAERIVRSAF